MKLCGPLFSCSETQVEEGGGGVGLAKRIPLQESAHLQLLCSKFQRGLTNLLRFNHKLGRGKTLR